MEGKVWKIKNEREKKKLICCVKKLKEKKNEKVKNNWTIFEVFDEIEREIERKKFERERSDSEKIWKRENKKYQILVKNNKTFWVLRFFKKSVQKHQ